MDGDYVYEGSDLLRLGEQLQNYNAAIADLIVRILPSEATVLDFGAGFGTLTRLVALRSRNLDCVEPDVHQREVLEADGFRCYPKVEAVPPGSYDVIYSSNVLEHIEDDVSALRQLRIVLRPNGKIVLYLPACQSLYSAVDAAIGHYRRYDVRMITECLNAAAFKVEQICYVDVLGFFVSWIFKRLSNRVSSVNVNTMRMYDRFVFPLSRAIERVIRVPFGKNILVVASCEDNPPPGVRKDTLLKTAESSVNCACRFLGIAR
jgi:SAM-dependent methyltransferase